MRFVREGGPGTRDPGLYRCQNCGLYQIVLEAYGIKLPAKFSGPDWLQSVRFDVSAKVPVDATEESFHSMLQNLLAERFQLVLHREAKDQTTYSLVVAKGGSKMQRSIAEVPSTSVTAVTPGMAVSTADGHVRVTASRQQLSKLTGFLSTLLGVGGPVVDETGLAGYYDFTLEYAPEASLAGDNGAGLSLFTALQSQLGLKLEEKKNLVDVLVVDHAQKKPTEN
jgi:uncharacterized protein (TIGR03435 family)